MSYLVTVIHADFEQKIREILAVRTQVAEDVHLSAWGKYTVGRLAKKISLSDLKGLLAAFDESCKENFSTAVVDTEHHVAYDNIESNRQTVAHSTGTSMTLADLEEAFRKTRRVIEEFEAALALGRP